MKDNTKTGGSPLVRLATFIVDKRNLFFLLTIIGIIFSVFSSNWVEVENNLAALLPDDSVSRQGLSVMEEQFTTFGTAQVMVANLTLGEAQAVQEQIAALDGVQMVEFDDSPSHYARASALYGVTFGYDEKDGRCLDTLRQVVLAGGRGREKVRFILQPIQQGRPAVPPDTAVIYRQKIRPGIPCDLFHVYLLFLRGLVAPGVPAVRPLAGE